MFPLLNKHLYIGKSVDGYPVVTFNSNYTGGTMRTPYINDPVAGYGRTYTQTEANLNSFNSGGSVRSQLGGFISSSFTDWRIPSKTEIDAMINIESGTGGVVTSNRPAWSSTEGIVGGIPTPSTKFVVGYSANSSPPQYIWTAYEADASSFGAFFIRDFTIR
jgi:hypothetical protein